MNRKTLGCGIALLLFGVGIIFTIQVVIPRLFHRGKSWFEKQVAEVQEVAAFERNWKPVSAAPDEKWFPATVGGWTGGAMQKSDGIPALKIERETFSASYQLNGQSMVVSVLSVNELEKEAILARAKKALESGSGTRSTSTLNNRLEVKLNGDDYTVFWGLNNWLFVFQTRGSVSPKDFARAYLEAIKAAEESALKVSPQP